MQENYYKGADVCCVIGTRFRAEGVGIGKEIKAKLLHYIIAFPFNIDTFFTIIEPKFSISPTTSPTKKC